MAGLGERLLMRLFRTVFVFSQTDSWFSMQRWWLIRARQRILVKYSPITDWPRRLLNLCAPWNLHQSRIHFCCLYKPSRRSEKESNTPAYFSVNQTSLKFHHYANLKGPGFVLEVTCNRFTIGLHGLHNTYIICIYNIQLKSKLFGLLLTACVINKIHIIISKFHFQMLLQSTVIVHTQ